MTTVVSDFQVDDLGIGIHCQYFSGYGVAFTPFTAVALVGDGPVTVRCHDGDCLLVECFGADVWEFVVAYHSLPAVVECGGVCFTKSAYRSDTQTAYYKAA